MSKKEKKFSLERIHKTTGYIPKDLDGLIKEVSKLEKDENLVRMNFEVTEHLKNQFKAKSALQGKKVKDVLVSLMEEYIKK